MNSLFIHIYQLIPLLILLLANIDSQHFFELPSYISKDQTLFLLCFLIYFSSIERQAHLRKAFLFVTISLLAFFSLNKMVLNPTFGTLVGAIYLIAVTRVLSDSNFVKRKTIPTFAVFTSFILAVVIFIAFLINQSVITAFSAGLACISTIYICFTKVGIKLRLRNLILLISTIALTYFVIYDYQFWFKISDYFLFIFMLIIYAFFMLQRTTKKVNNLLVNTFTRPEIIIIGFFSLFGILGAFALSSSFSQTSNLSHSIIDSLFTAFSAICITGLVVLDTGTDFSTLGQFIILILIEIGAIGIVSMSAWVLLLSQNNRLSLEHEQTINQMSGYQSFMSAQSIIAKVFVYFFGIQAAGAFLLFIGFYFQGETGWHTVWKAVFTAVSAFCNAGFALQSDSLIPYQKNTLVLMTSSFLIIAGSFSPVLAFSLPKDFWMKKMNLHSKIAITTTAILLIVGFVVYAAFEWQHSLASLSVFDKFNNAWLQSASARTAGFNSIEMSETRDITNLFLMVLMFIGGNPGGAAGGIKTVTFALLVLAVLNALKGNQEVRAFNRKIPTAAIFKALTITMLGLVVGSIAFTALSLTQHLPAIPLMFETVSALGTVGLSLGITSELDEVGKTIVILCMLLGRVGPITFIVLILRQNLKSNWHEPTEEVYVS